MKQEIQIQFRLSPLPKDEQEAVQWLLPLVQAADSNTLQEISNDDFKRGWYSVGFLYAGLHPDSVLENGTCVSNEAPDHPLVSQIEPRLIRPFYEESGWPVALVPVALEAWRRYEAKELADDELYCSEATVAGMCHRSPELAEQVRREREQAPD